MRTDVANTPENDARTVDYGRKRPTGRPTRRCRCRYAHVTAAARQSMRRSSGRGDGVACSSSSRLMVLIFLGRGYSSIVPFLHLGPHFLSCRLTVWTVLLPVTGRWL
ncbi:unnamed protein product [Sphagnum tenellum]